MKPFSAHITYEKSLTIMLIMLHIATGDVEVYLNKIFNMYIYHSQFQLYKDRTSFGIQVDRLSQGSIAFLKVYADAACHTGNIVSSTRL